MNETSEIEYSVIKTVQRLVGQVELLSIDELKRLHTALSNFNNMLETHLENEKLRMNRG